MNSAPETTPKLLLSAREAAKAPSICERTLWTLTQPRGSLPAVRIGARVLYSTAALQQWIDAQAVGVGRDET